MRYFTTIVDGEPGAQSRQAHYIAALQAKHPNILTVHQGRYQKKEIRCRDCGSSWHHREEKETDVNVAVAMVADAANGLMDDVMVISADSDLVPAARTAKEVNSRLFIVAAFPPKRYSNELKKLLPASFSIGASKVSKAQLPDKFTANGRTFIRPDKWK